MTSRACSKAMARVVAVLIATEVLAAHADAPAVNSDAAMTSESGAEIYQHICQGCHMAQAQGAKGAAAYPKLANNVSLTAWQYVALTVLNGRSAMPAFGMPTGQVSSGLRSALLSDAQIAAVINYVRTHFGNRYRDVVTAAQVATLPHPSLGPEL
jgi:mono/diheme cytochrome c family protein